MEKIVVGLSGGVDSSVTAYLLKNKGYDVVGVTMKTWFESGNGSDIYIEDAKKVADSIGIEHVVIDYSENFKKYVVDNFLSEYMCARTPNPCVRCNRFVKWQSLIDYADSIGADYIATGHYAHVVKLDNGRYTVLQAKSEKDQSYALYMLSQEQLSRTQMPLGDYDKTEIRRIAEEIGIVVADKPDSQDICFVPDGDYAAFLVRQIGKGCETPGDFVDIEGNVIGRHKGLIHYTVGQRKGLELAMGEPVYVVGLDSANNRVIIGHNDDVFGKELIIDNVNYMGIAEGTENFDAIAKIRYAHKGAFCHVSCIDGGKLKVVFDEPQRAITPGQSVVFYEETDEGRIVLAGGMII